MKTGDKCDEIARGQFSKITETACLSVLEFEADNRTLCIDVTKGHISITTTPV